MAEFEFAGMTFRGGRMVGVVMALSTAVGGLYGAFEFYKDYMDMKEQIQKYVAPDLSEFHEKLSVLDARMSSIDENVIVIKDSYRMELDDIKKEIDGVENLARIVDKNTADTQRDLRNNVYGLEQRVNDSLRIVDKDVRELRSELEEKIEKILSNPLNKTE